MPNNRMRRSNANPIPPAQGDRAPENVHGEKGTYHYECRAGYLVDTAKRQTKEVTFGRWNGEHELKLDIRWWEGDKYLSGISLTEKEVRDLRRILDDISFGE